jgi:uncharacterized protein
MATTQVFTVTFYAGLNALIGLVLAVLVTRQRIETRTEIGSGTSPGLERAIRAHANFIEYVPLILLLLLLLALGGVPAFWLHGLGIALTVARLLHGWGLSTSSGRSFGRATGAALTWLVMLVALIVAIWIGLGAF